MDHSVENSCLDPVLPEKNQDLEKFLVKYFFRNKDLYGIYTMSEEHQEFSDGRRIPDYE